MNAPLAPDPLLVSLPFVTQGDQRIARTDWWHAKGHGDGRQLTERAHALLMDYAWGTPEAPGPSLWVARGMAHVLRQPGTTWAQAAHGLTQALNDPNLPAHALDLWPKAYDRKQALMAVFSETGPEAAALQTLVLDRHPVLIQWLCADREAVIGPWPTPDAPTARVSGYIKKHPLYGWARPQHGAAPLSAELWARVWAIDPLAGLTAEAQRETLVQLALALRDWSVLAPLGLTAQAVAMDWVDPGFGRAPLPLLHHVAKRGDLSTLELLLDAGAPLDARDQFGQALFHAIGEGLSGVVKNHYDQWDPKPRDQLLAEMNAALVVWQRLRERGLDDQLPALPAVMPRMSKTTGLPVKGQGWGTRTASPGETALEALARRAQKASPLPADLVAHFIAGVMAVNVEQTLATTVGQPAPAPRRARL